MLAYNTLSLFSVHLNISNLFLACFKNLNNRLELADTYAACLRNSYLFGQALFVHFFNKGV